MDLDETWQVWLRPEKSKLARSQRNRAMGFGESAKKVAEALFFCDVNDAPLLPLPLFRVPICDQPTGHVKRSATPTLFPFPSGHPTDVPFLGDFCSERCTVFHLSTSKSVLISNGHTWMRTQSRHLARGGTLLNRPIIFSNITRQVAPP